MEITVFASSKSPIPHSIIVQKWSEENLPDFISKNEWPFSSPDLNRLDFSIWNNNLTQLKNYKYRGLDEFKAVILKIRAAIPDQVVRAMIEEALEKCLRLVIKFKGQFIEKRKVF
jgi:hypothetical protein